MPVVKQPHYEKATPTHWRVLSEYSEVQPCILIRETDKSVTYDYLGKTTDGDYVKTNSKPSIRMKSANKDMRFFENRLDAIDYLASLMIREQEVHRQRMLEWGDRIADLKLLRSEVETWGQA